MSNKIEFVISRPQDILYHYCSMESLYGIISSGNIWLSNSDYSNDPNENKIAKNLLEEIAKNSSNKNIKKFASLVLSDKVEIITNMAAYVFCLSEKNDDLNQWRIYGDNGYGAMFGLKTNTDFFSCHRLWNILNDEKACPTLEKIYFDKCIYDSNEQKKIVEFFLSMFSLVAKENEKVAIFNFKIFFKLISSFFKHESYKDENEWRLVCLPVTQSQHNTVKYEVKYRTTRGLIVSYIEINYSINAKFKNMPFSVILIGSNAYNTQKEIMDFVSSKGHLCERLSKSEIKIREYKKI